MADIQLQNPTSPDIFSFGFDKGLNRPLEGVSSGVVYDAIGEALNTGQVFSGGNLNLKSLSIGGLVKQVSPGDDIQAAIDDIHRQGGGTVQLLAKTYLLQSEFNLKDGVFLNGAGRDITILDFEGRAAGVLAKGNSADILENWGIANLTVQNSNHTAGIDIDFADFWRMENVRVTSCDQRGIRMKNTQNYIMVNVRSDNNTSYGFSWDGGDRLNELFTLTNCESDTNSLGFLMSTLSGTSRIRRFSFINCRAHDNSGDGFDFTLTGSAFDSDSQIIGGSSRDNGGKGYDGSGGFLNITFVGCGAYDNTDDGFEINIIDAVLAGVNASGNGVDYDINDRVTIVGGNIEQVDNEATKPSAKVSLNSSFTGDVMMLNNAGESPQVRRRYVRMKNVTGSSLGQGDVVVYGFGSSDVEEITTTTTAGDSKVLGSCIAVTHFNNQMDNILVEGFTSVLKADGTTDIAVGDYLSTFTTAGIAKKASAGETVFAVALEAYTTDDSNGVINAYLLPWRMKI